MRSKQRRLEGSLQEHARTRLRETKRSLAEISLLFDEVMAAYDKSTRQIVYRRLEGFSWKEIATEFGITTHAAEARYSRALAQAHDHSSVYD